MPERFVFRQKPTKSAVLVRYQELAGLKGALKKRALKELTGEMDLAAWSWEFEKAIELRDLIKKLKS